MQSPREGLPLTPWAQSSASLANELTQIKIRLRGLAENRRLAENEAGPAESVQTNGEYDLHQGSTKKRRVISSLSDFSGQEAFAMDDERDREVLGRDDVSVRFLWKEDAAALPA